VYVATEARSMVAGAVAFFAYACVVSFVLMRWRPKALMTATAVLPLAVCDGRRALGALATEIG
jgi:hypothetical protein